VAARRHRPLSLALGVGGRAGVRGGRGAASHRARRDCRRSRTLMSPRISTPQPRGLTSGAAVG